MLFDADELRRNSFVRYVEFHETLGSTNDRAAELARQLDDDALPALVVARMQTAGRGRGTNKWWSADGALAFSLLLETRRWGIAQREWPQLSLVIAGAVRAALAEHVPSARVCVKPPNDILIDGRKVCGILIESPGGGAPAKDRLIVGVGVNVNNSWRDAPESLAGLGTSLTDAAGRKFDLPRVLNRVLQEIQGQLTAAAPRFEN